MKILISSEESWPEEIDLIREILALDASCPFHVRKPDWDVERLAFWLENFEASDLKRMVVHSSPEMKNYFSSMKLHASEILRLKGSHTDFESTSFHQKEDALDSHSSFKYFFCSPVFASISKKGYTSQTSWNIQDCPLDFKEKAVALGGMDLNKIQEAKQLGFQHFAFLGAVWQSKTPVLSWKNILSYEV